MDVPFELRYLKAKQDIVDSVNNAIKIYKIPYVILDTVLTDISRQIQQSAAMERDLAQKKYEEYIKTDTPIKEDNESVCDNRQVSESDE